jgi:hypothetical protein
VLPLVQLLLAVLVLLLLLLELLLLCSLAVCYLQQYLSLSIFLVPALCLSIFLG